MMEMLTRFGSRQSLAADQLGWKTTEEALPQAGENVLYRTGEHQALGVYEGMNRWRCSNGEVEAAAVLLWQPLYSI